MGGHCAALFLSEKNVLSLWFVRRTLSYRSFRVGNDGARAMPKPKTVSAYFESLDPHQKAIAIGLEDVIKTHWPHLTVKLAWGFPCWSANERVFSIMGQADRCNLQLWQGANLAKDYLDRIEGSGKSLRHVKVFSLADVNDELIDIMDRAVSLDAMAPQRVR